MDVFLKANEDAFEIFRKINDNDVDQKFLDELFKERNFQGASGKGLVRAIYRSTAISYTPTQFAGGLKLVNPSLPVVHIKGIHQSVFRASQYLVTDWMSRYGELIFSPSLFFAKRSIFTGDFDLLSAAGQKPKKLIKKENVNKMDGNFGVSLLSKRWFLPSINLKVDNVASQYPCKKCEEGFFELEQYYGLKSSASISFSGSHPIGQSLIGVVFPFWGIYEDYDTLKTALSYVYRISKLDSFVSFSPLMRSFGFMFESEFFRVGIQYSNEKQENQIEIKRLEQTYVFGTFYI